MQRYFGIKCSKSSFSLNEAVISDYDMTAFISNNNKRCQMKDSNITKIDFGRALKGLIIEKEFEKIRVHEICEKSH